MKITIKLSKKSWIWGSIIIISFFSIVIGAYLSKSKISNKNIINTFVSSENELEEKTVGHKFDIDSLYSKDKRISFNEEIKSPKIIFRMSDVDCEPCIMNNLKLLKQLDRIIGQDKIIIVAKATNIRVLKAQMERFGVQFKYYNYFKEITIPIEKNRDSFKPYLVLINQDRVIEKASYLDEGLNFNTDFFDYAKKYEKWLSGDTLNSPQL